MVGVEVWVAAYGIVDVSPTATGIRRPGLDEGRCVRSKTYATLCTALEVPG
jgi:hypothetical protein